MHAKMLIVSVMCTMAVAGAAVADAVVPNAARMGKLKGADTNSDNRVDFDEFMAAFPQADRSAFDLYDKNSDGFLTRQDMPDSRGADSGRAAKPRAGIRALLQQADKDGNGAVTFEEIAAVAPKIKREQFVRFDRNGDGSISEADEATGKPGVPTARRDIRAIATKADKDGDGQVTFDELRATFPKLTQERFSMLDRNSDGVLSQADRPAASDGGPNSGRKARGQFVHKVLQADADGDSKVTYGEVTAKRPGFPRAAFDRLDANGDGVLSREDAAGAHTD